jgi:hypothetical protein
MKRMNLARQLPKFKNMGDRVATHCGLLQVSGLLPGTISEVYDVIMLPPKVWAGWRCLAEQCGMPASLIADARQDGFALPGSSLGIIRLANRQASREEN